MSVYTLEDYKPPKAVQSSRSTLQINELKTHPTSVDLNLHRCK